VSGGTRNEERGTGNDERQLATPKLGSFAASEGGIMDQLTLTVTGMSCGGCENAIQRALSTLEGVSNVSASHRDNRVTLTYDAAKIDRAAIEKRIENAGYEVRAA
jgi:copper chaperone